MKSLFVFVIHFGYIIGVYTQTLSYNLEISIGYSENNTYTLKENNDAYQVIQDSLNQLKNNGGGILRFEAGTYILSQNIEVDSNIAVIGAGLNITILKLIDNAKPWWEPSIGLRKSGFIRSKRTKNLYFANFTIDGNKQNQGTDELSSYGRYGLYTEAVDNVIVDGMGIINFQGYGFDPHGLKSGVWSNGLIIINSYAGNNDWDGYTIDQSANVFMQNNIAYNNGRHGFNFVTGTYNVIMYNNLAVENGYSYYLGNPGCGVAIQNNLDFGTRNITVKNNIFQDDYDAGICVRDVSLITLENNIIANLDYTNTSTHLCIELFNTTSTTLKNNTCNKTLPQQFTSLSILINIPTVTTLSNTNKSIHNITKSITTSNANLSKILSNWMFFVSVLLVIIFT